MIRLTLIFAILVCLASCSKVQNHEYLYPISVKGKMGFIDSLGNVKVECKFDYVGDFSDGLAIAVIDSMYGYIDTKGNFIIEPKYNIMDHIAQGTEELIIKPLNLQRRQEFLSHLNSGPDTIFNYDIPDIFSFKEGRVVFRDKSLFGYLNIDGDTIIKAQYTFAQEFSEGLAAVRVTKEATGNSLYGYIDLIGKEVIEPQYTVATAFSENRASVGITYDYKDQETSNTLFNIKMFVINPRGQIVFSPEVQYLTNFQEGFAGTYNLAYASLTGAGWNFIDSTGKYYYPYDKLSFLKVRGVSNPESLSDSVAYYGKKFLVQSINGKWGYLPEDITTHDKSADQTYIYDDAFIFSENLANVKINGKWGYIDAFESFVIEPLYTTAKGFNHGLAYVEQVKNGFKLKGYINKKGIMVWSTKEY